MFLRELKARFGKNKYLGYFWVIGEPMSVILILTTIVTILREYHHQLILERISIFMSLISGIVPYFMFRNIVTQLMNDIGANLALFAYKPVKPIHVSIARTLLEFCIYSVIFVAVLFTVGWFFRLEAIPRHFLSMMICIFLLMCSGFALGMVFAIIGYFLEPSKTLLNYFSIAFYWGSGAIFPTWLMPKPILDILYYNLLLHVMELLRFNFFENYPLQDNYIYTYPIFRIICTSSVGLFLYYYNKQALTAVRRT